MIWSPEKQLNAPQIRSSPLPVVLQVACDCTCELRSLESQDQQFARLKACFCMQPPPTGHDEQKYNGMSARHAKRDAPTAEKNKSKTLKALGVMRILEAANKAQGRRTTPGEAWGRRVGLEPNDSGRFSVPIYMRFPCVRGSNESGLGPGPIYPGIMGLRDVVRKV